MSGFVPKRVRNGRIRTKTKQPGLNMQGDPSAIGRRSYLKRAVNRRVHPTWGLCGFGNLGFRCMYEVDPKTAGPEAIKKYCVYENTRTRHQVCLPEAHPNAAIAGGVGRKNVPRLGCRGTCDGKIVGDYIPPGHPARPIPGPPPHPPPPPPPKPTSPPLSVGPVTNNTITLKWTQDAAAINPVYLLKSWGPLTSAALSGTPNYNSNNAVAVPLTPSPTTPYGSLSLVENNATVHIHNLDAATNYKFLLGVTADGFNTPILSTPTSTSSTTPPGPPQSATKVGFWLESSDLTQSIANLSQTLASHTDMTLGNVYIRINGAGRSNFTWTAFDQAQNPQWTQQSQTFITLITNAINAHQTQWADAKIWLMPYQTSSIGYTTITPTPPANTGTPPTTTNLSQLTSQYMDDMNAFYTNRGAAIKTALGANWGGIAMEYENSSMNTGSNGEENTLGPARTYQTDSTGLMSAIQSSSTFSSNNVKGAVTSFFSIIPQPNVATPFMNSGNQCVQQYYDQQETCPYSTTVPGSFPCLNTAADNSLPSLPNDVAQNLVNGFADKELNDNQNYIRMLSLANGFPLVNTPPVPAKAYGALGLVGLPNPDPVTGVTYPSWAKIKEILTKFHHLQPQPPPSRAAYDAPWVTGNTPGFNSFTFWVPEAMADATTATTGFFS